MLGAAAAALLALAAAVPAAAQAIGEPLGVAGEHYGLSAVEVAALHAAGGEFYCPGNGRDGARLNAWLIGPDTIVTNAHGIVNTDRAPKLRQPLTACSFTSYLELGKAHPREVMLDFRGVAAWVRRGARAPVDPTDDVGGDVVKFRLAEPIVRGQPLHLDATPLVAGDAVLLVSRVPTGLVSANRPASDLVIQRCQVLAKDPPSLGLGPSVLTDCKAAAGMSGGVLLTRVDGALVARGLLVSVRYLPGSRDDPEKLIGAHHLAFGPAFMRWITRDCPFWPPALKGKSCP